MSAAETVRRKRVLVTGASRGIGRAVAVAFAGEGARVAVHFHSNEDAADQTLQSMNGEGHVALGADISIPDDARRMVEEAIDSLGGLDVLVNNAGVYLEHAVGATSYEEWNERWRRTIDVNLIGAANVSWCAARHMMQSGGGKIVNVSSRGAFRGEPDHPAYGASKAGLNSMGQSLAVALGPHGITVATVAPGFVETDMAAEYLDGPGGDAIRRQSPLGRVATAEEIAAVVVFLASEKATFATGAIVDVNGASYLRT